MDRAGDARWPGQSPRMGGQVPTAAPTPHARFDGVHPASDFSQVHLAPRQTVVTTTTTTTVHFAPIVLPRSRTIVPVVGTPALSSAAAFASFMDTEEERPLQLDPKLYPLSQQPWPGGMRKFRLALGGLEGTFVEGGVDDGLDEGEFVGGAWQDKGKGKEIEGGASATRSGRGAHALRRKSRRSRGGLGASLGSETADDELDMMDSGVDMAGPGGTGIARLPSPGPPRKRPRADAHRSRSSSIDSELDTVRLADPFAPVVPGSIAATLPSPNLSPPSPVPTFFAGDDSQDDREVEAEATAGANLSPVVPTDQYDLGSGQALSGLLSLPDFVDTFDQLSPALQSYFIFTFLKRSSIPVLQTINNIIAPSLRRDFLTDLPPELGIQILGYLDAKTLCRASVVCKGWRRLVDGEWRVWRERLAGDGLWIGDGSEAREAKEITSGSKENLFLQRWKAGVWDDASSTRRASKPWEHKRDTEDMHIDRIAGLSRPTQPTNLASPSSSREASPFPSGHYVHPFKTLYRRRFVTRRNWAEKEPKRVAFACHANNVVTCLQFDKDKIVSASDDHSINVFDTRTGETKARLDGHEGGVWALQYIGNILVSGSTDRTVRVWDLEKGTCTHIFVGHTSTVRCLQIVEPENIQTDPRGEPIWEPPYPLIVTGSRDWSLRVWKLPSPERDKMYHPHVPMSPTEENTDPSDNPFHLRHLAGHRHAVRALAAHGRTLVSGSYDCTVRVWDMLTGECKHRLAGHTQKVYSVVYDHQRRQCASGSMDGTVRLWSTETGECRATLEGHTSLVGLLGLSYRTVVSAAADSTLRIWDPSTGECRHTLTAHSGAITCFQHDEYKVISGSDGTLKMWDVQTGLFTRDLLTGLTGVWQVSFDSRFCVAAVQRNGQSEFEILDFGAIDAEEEREMEEIKEEEGLEPLEAMDQSGVGLPDAPSSSSRTVHPAQSRATVDLPPLLPLPRLAQPLALVAPVRAVRRTDSMRALVGAPSTSTSTTTAAAGGGSYRERIEAANDWRPLTSTSSRSAMPIDVDDPFAAAPRSRVAPAAMEVEAEADDEGDMAEID